MVSDLSSVVSFYAFTNRNLAGAVMRPLGKQML